MCLETQWGQVTTTLFKSPFNFEDNITKNEHSALFFLFYFQAVFQKVLRLQKDTWKLNFIMGLLKKCLHFPRLSLSPTSLPQTPSPCREEQVEKIIINKYNNQNNTILYPNIFIEVHLLTFLSNDQSPSTSETHSII